MMLEFQDFQVMFDKNPLAHAVVDSQMKIVLVNDPFCKLVGFNRERVTGMPFSDFRNRQMITYVKDSGESVSDAMGKKRMTVGESTFETPTGRHVVIRTNIPLFDESGKVKYVYITYNEITKIVKDREYMAHEIDELSKVYARMAGGDLTLRYEITKPDDDTRETYALLIKFRDAVRGIIGNLQTNIRDVNRRMLALTTSAATASRSLEDASKGIEQVARNAGQVSDKMVKATHNIDEINKTMQDMSAAVEEITSSMENVSTQANGAKDAAQSGAVLAENVNTGMKNINDASNRVYDVVQDIARQMSDISKIIVLIRDLANQTNLLALNAAIEAARAGEYGRGFAVVATEVKSLAQESRSSAERIEEMIKNLNTATKMAIDAMETSKSLVSTGLKASTEAFDAFKEIHKAAENVARSASDVAAATEEQAATTEEITATTHEVASIIDMTAKESTDTAAATEESSAAIDEITRMIREVSTVASEAMDANRKFKVE